MTVEAVVTENVIQLAGAQLGQFPTGWTYEKPSDVQVWLDPGTGVYAELDQSGDYALNATAPTVSGGFVLLSSTVLATGVWASGARLAMVRRSSTDQPSSFGDTSDFDPATSEGALDHVERQGQELQAMAVRAVAAPFGEPGYTFPPRIQQDGFIKRVGGLLDIDQGLPNANRGLALLTWDNGPPPAYFGIYSAELGMGDYAIDRVNARLYGPKGPTGWPSSFIPLIPGSVVRFLPDLTYELTGADQGVTFLCPGPTLFYLPAAMQPSFGVTIRALSSDAPGYISEKTGGFPNNVNGYGIGPALYGEAKLFVTDNTDGASADWVLSGSTLAWDAATVAYLARYTGGYDARWQFVVNMRIARAKLTGAWAVRDAHYFLAAPNLQGALLNAAGATLNLTAYNSPVQTANLGVKFDGATQYLDTGIAHLNTQAGLQLTLNSHALGDYIMNDESSVAFEVGCGAGGAVLGLRARNAISAAVWSMNSAAVLASAAAATGGLSFTRNNDPANIRLNKNGSAKTNPIASSAVPTGALLIGRLGGGAGGYSPALIGEVWFGGGLTAAQQDAEYVGQDYMYQILGTRPTLQPEAITNGYFTKAQIANVMPAGLKVLMEAPKPLDDVQDQTPANPDGVSYNYFPLTHSDTFNNLAESVSTCTTVRTMLRQWQMRSSVSASGGVPWNDRPNNINITPTPTRVADGLECRLRIGSYDKADAATLAGIAHLLGALQNNDPSMPNGQGWQDIALAAGFTLGQILSAAAILASPDALFPNVYTSKSGTYAVPAGDAMFVQQATGAQCLGFDGIVLDAEAQDDRTPARQQALWTSINALVAAKGKVAVCFLNQLGIAGGGAERTGFDQSWLYQLPRLSNCKGAIMCYGGNPQHDIASAIAAQKAMYSGPAGDQPYLPGEMMLIAGLGVGQTQISEADAYVIHAELLTGYWGVDIWRDGLPQGGGATDEVNRLISIILFGAPPE